GLTPSVRGLRSGPAGRVVPGMASESGHGRDPAACARDCSTARCAPPAELWRQHVWKESDSHGGRERSPDRDTELIEAEPSSCGFRPIRTTATRSTDR